MFNLKIGFKFVKHFFKSNYLELAMCYSNFYYYILLHRTVIFLFKNIVRVTIIVKYT